MDELTSAFLPVADDPAQVAQLYGFLREFCHDLRGKLGEYRMAAYMARRNGATGPAEAVLERFETRYGNLLGFLDVLQMICRPMVPSRECVALRSVLDEAQRRWTAELARRGRSLHWVAPSGPTVASLDTFLLGHALDAFVTWRAEVGVGGEGVRACWVSEPRRLRLDWDEPGVALRPTSSPLPCLAPVLLGRTLRAHGGTMILDDQEGFHLELTLPTEGIDLDTVPGPSRGLKERLSVGAVDPLNARE